MTCADVCSHRTEKFEQGLPWSAQPVVGACREDDRDQRAGIKFKDADLLGIPFRITIGDTFKKEKKVEIKYRDSKKTEFLDEQELDAFLEKL